jgi:two-component system, chemotaxis family, CheB/CheR fusion protein
MKKRSPRPPKAATAAESGPAKSAPVLSKSPDEISCPVVGVGASAGGLEAFTELLKHLPQKTGLAYALVQHLDPSRESHLREILSRTTQMPVVEASDGLRLEPNRVYVVPPGASMTVTDGVLQVGPREEGRGRHLPIDRFFQSLAAHRGSKAIGVVLSGNASDGTVGLKAIKAADGITFAQSEDSAKFPGMPRSAVSAGCVDFVLPPEKIAEELARLGGHPYLTANQAREPETGQNGDGLKRIFKLLRTATGVDFSNYRQTTIRRRIQRRVTVQRVEEEEYLKLLEKNPAELQALFHDFLIHVTNFFREPETFAALARHVFPELLKDRGLDEPLRVWVPGCSTGEEVYSLAISLMEFLGDKTEVPAIQIFGTDASERVIETARKGVYDAGIEADVSPERLRRFFGRVEGGFQITKSIRDLCVFARQNLIKDPPFSKLDLVSCRNVLIYFEPALQKKLIPVFHYALKPQGYLLLGSAENVNRFDELFTAIDQKNKIFLKRPNGNTTPSFAHPPEGDDIMQREAREASPDARASVWSRLDIHKEADRLLLAKFCPPALVIDDAMEIIQFRGEVVPYLNPAPGQASLNLFKMTHPGLAMELRSAILSARKGDGTPRRHVVRLGARGDAREVTMEVLRIDPPAVSERCFIILFEEQPPLAATAGASKKSKAADERTARLEEELSASKEHVQALIEEHEATNEELRSANEEIQSSNEELQSTNEELETAKEELQSTNEELTTLNEELKRNNDELNSLNDDLNNLLRTVGLPVVMLGRDLRIRRFTPSAQKLFKLIATDVGRAITDIQADIDVPDLAGLVHEAIDHLCLKEVELRDRQDHWYRLQIRPYETAENKIAGAVLILFDIDAARRSAHRLQHAANYSEAIVETVREPLLVLDGKLRIKRATTSFCTQFRVRPDAINGRLLYELGNRQWDIPALRSLLEEVLPRNTHVENFAVEHVFPKIGKKKMLLNARTVEPTPGEEPLIVLSITEVPA